MRIARLSIQNFRGITDLTLLLDRTTVLIGENNTGKTSILEALHTCMSRGMTRRATPFSEYDFHLANDAAEPSNAPPLVITLTFEESKEDEWAPEIDQAFDKAVQILDDNRKQLNFRVTSRFDAASRDFAVEWAFLDKAGSLLPTAKQPKLVIDLQALAPVFLLGAVRDASQHFHAKSPFWSPFTKNPQIDDATREEIESQIETINQAILDKHKPFDVVKTGIAKTGTLLPLASQDLVSVEAVPARIFDMLAKTQVKLACRTGARLPITQHGAGTQSLSVLFLFEAFLQSRLAEAYDKHSEPILALEEPESHLHPSAIRALWSTLDGLAGQKIIATHSGDLLAAVPLKAIRRLVRKNSQVQVFNVKDSTLNVRDLEKVTYHIRAKRGALLFARCWLFVEGETDFTVLPEVARLLGHDFDLSGISCVEFSQCGLKPLIKVAQDLGIEWHLLADGDPTGQTYQTTARQFLGADPAADRITGISLRDIEHCFWHAGYHAVYENAVDANHRRFVTAAPGSPQYPTETITAAIKSTSKPHLAYEVIAAAGATGSPSVPADLKSAIDMAIALAGRSA
jgi:putative ATP-dependent endonuclease of the OLD family